MYCLKVKPFPNFDPIFGSWRFSFITRWVQAGSFKLPLGNPLGTKTFGSEAEGVDQCLDRWKRLSTDPTRVDLQQWDWWSKVAGKDKERGEVGEEPVIRVLSLQDKD